MDGLGWCFDRRRVSYVVWFVFLGVPSRSHQWTTPPNFGQEIVDRRNKIWQLICFLDRRPIGLGLCVMDRSYRVMLGYSFWAVLIMWFRLRETNYIVNPNGPFDSYKITVNKFNLNSMKKKLYKYWFYYLVGRKWVIENN